uniref:DUF4806 domain-containing protein n=1 Tax=Anopheles minimus TaxID=112268 RepID=A0A182WHM3_9DIPT
MDSQSSCLDKSGTAGECPCQQEVRALSRQLFKLTKAVVDLKKQRSTNPVEHHQRQTTVVMPSTERNEPIPLISSQQELQEATVSKQRLHEALHLLINRLFLAECSWSGRGGKVAFRQFANVLRLFEQIGGAEDPVQKSNCKMQKVVQTKEG